MEEAPEIVAIGNAIVDVFAAVDEEIGPLLGLHPNRAVHVDYERLREILVALPDPSVCSGGGAANVAKIASQLGLRTAFIGRVGSDRKGKSDHFAEVFESDLRDCGVLPLLARGAEPTGACAIIRMPGDLIATAACPQAALGLDAEDVDEDLIRGAKILVLDGFILGRERLVSRALEIADRYGTVVALDVASSGIAADRAEAILGMCEKYPMILFMNQDEADAFSCAVSGRFAASCPDRSEDEADDAAGMPFRKLTEEGPFPVVVVKKGKRGAVVYAGGAVHEARARAAVPFDATGAGDAFAAGFLSAWVRGKSLDYCAALGNRVARETISVPGTKLDGARLRRFRRGLSTST